MHHISINSPEITSPPPFCGVIPVVVPAEHQLEIFYPVVLFIAVYMMHNFVIFQISSDMFFHNKAVLHNISLRISPWVIWAQNSIVFTFASILYAGLFFGVIVSPEVFGSPFELALEDIK